MQDMDSGLSEMTTDLKSTFTDLISGFSLGDGSADFKKLIVIAVLILLVLLVLFIVHLIIQGVNNRKINKMQNEHFKETLNLISRFQNSNYKNNTENKDHVLQGEFNLSQNQIEELSHKCQKLGERIDEYTDRPNNSKNISELVYKVSLALGLDSSVASLYFCISLVYDAGFLDLPEDLFRIEILNAKEKKLIKTHVLRGMGYYDFVPEECKELFTLASMLHHENINGTGYPEGLRGESIPQIARILHVVESYVSLVSHRRYHPLRDKISAVKELRMQPGIYDMDIIDALESVM